MKVYSVINDYLYISDKRIVFNLKENNGVNIDICFIDGKVTPDDADAYEQYKQYDVIHDTAIFDTARDIVMVLLDIQKPRHRKLKALTKTDQFALAIPSAPDFPKDSVGKPILINSAVFIKSLERIGKVVFMGYDGDGSWKIEIGSNSGIFTTFKLPNDKEDLVIFGYDDEA